MFRTVASRIPGCHEIQPRVAQDVRGRFVKVFHRGEFERLGFETVFAEEYYSLSKRNVIRGMHFQIPPADHVKVVYCVQGEVFDVVLDLRVGSPTYGQVDRFTLSADRGNYLYIPRGLAHGFCALSDIATLVYKVSTVYAPDQDCGIHWASIGVDWPTQSPIVSERDCAFPSLADFSSPFRHDE